MSEGTADSVLERKALAQRQALGAGAVSVSRALGRSLSLAADALWALGLTTAVKSDEIVPTARAFSRLPDDQMLIVLEKEDGPCAIVGIDRALVTGVTEVQTLGKVTRFPLDQRPFTPTDAAMLAPLLDAALPRFSSMLAGQPDRTYLQGYGFGALVDDVQTAALALDVESCHVIRFDIALAQDQRSGQIVILFPEAVKPIDTVDAGACQSGKYEAALQLVPAQMQAILTRIHIPLVKVQSLKPGDVLEISANALTSASLVVDGGHVAARGKMGQMNGFRAVRIGGEDTLVRAPTPGNDETIKGASVPAVFQPGASLRAPRPENQTSDISMGTEFDSMSAGLGDPADLL
jgi:flagellar motor switch protein FliM